jgi:hypothetical protein
VSVVCWLLASADATDGDLAALHGPRLESLLGTLVDSGVRGLVYEAAGSAPAELLERGRGLALESARRHRMPVALIEADPADPERWLAAARDAFEAVLSG